MPELSYGASPDGPRTDPAMDRFRGYRLGQFIHFGLYAMPAGSWQGREYPGAAEFLPKWADIDPAEWRKLADDFRLPAFDPDAWADAAVRMGARYVTITTKHHEGFCLWPTELTDFNIANTPYGKDLLGELIKAYRGRGLAVHLYYSVLDWDHPDWRYRIESDQDAAAFRRYLEFAEAQLLEMADRYPEVGGFWFDGTWDESVKANGRWTWRIEQLLKERLPGVVINSRLRADDLGARHFDSNGELMGDYESGYERRLPDPWDRSVTERDWEACMTIGEATWGHHNGDSAQATLKHPWELADMLAQCVAQGGNLLINLGPRGDGSLHPREVDITDRLGRWVGDHSAALHDAGPATRWDYQSWGHLTSARTDAAQVAPTDSVVHAIITRPPAAGQVIIRLPAGVTVAMITRHNQPDQRIDWLQRSEQSVLIMIDQAAISTRVPTVVDLHIRSQDSPPPPAKELV